MFPAPAGRAAAEYLFVINVRELAVLDLNAVGAVARIVDHAVMSVFLYAVHDAAHSGALDRSARGLRDEHDRRLHFVVERFDPVVHMVSDLNDITFQRFGAVVFYYHICRRSIDIAEQPERLAVEFDVKHGA